MPATVIDDPLGIDLVCSDGTRATLPLGNKYECPLGRDLMLGLTVQVHPHGDVDSSDTVYKYVRAARDMVRFMRSKGSIGGIDSLNRALLAEYWMSCGFHFEINSRYMVRGYAEATGRLPPELLEFARGRNFHRFPKSEPLRPYTAKERDQIETMCHEIIDRSFEQYQHALATAASQVDRTEGTCTPDDVLRVLARIGPADDQKLARELGVGRSRFANRPELRLRALHARLFPPAETALAYRTLFALHSGIVPDGIADLGLGDIDWAGDATILLSYVKGRTSPESVNLPKAAIKILGQWLRHSATLRKFAPADKRDALWLRWEIRGGHAFQTKPFRSSTIGEVCERHGLTVGLHQGRFRVTFEAMRDRSAWTGTGRTTIDPNHSPRVEAEHYLGQPTPAQLAALETVIEEAQGDMLRRGLRPPTVLTMEQTADQARDFPSLIKKFDLTEEAVAELVGGQRDVFTAACVDQLAGLHGPKGKPCPARPWVCLVCPLAVFAPRHAANLLRLKAWFARKWLEMPADHFLAQFGLYADRVDEIVRKFDRAVLAEAEAEVADTDQEIPLRPEESAA